MSMRNVLNTLLVVLAISILAPAGYSQNRVIIGPSTYAPNGVTVNDGVTTSTTAAAVTISSTPGMIYGMYLDAGANTANTVVWMNFFNATSGNVTPGTTVPIFSFQVANGLAGSIVPFPFGNPIGIPFSTALSANCSTLRSGSVAVTAPCHYTVMTKK